MGIPTRDFPIAPTCLYQHTYHKVQLKSYNSAGAFLSLFCYV